MPAMQGYGEFNYYHNKIGLLHDALGRQRLGRLPRRPGQQRQRARSAPRTPTTRTSAPRRACAIWLPTSARASATSRPTSIASWSAIKGTAAGWDYDSALLYSEDKVANSRTGYPAARRDVRPAQPDRHRRHAAEHDADNAQSAALTNPAYAALPAGSVLAHRRERRPQLGRRCTRRCRPRSRTTRTPRSRRSTSRLRAS